MSSDNSEGEPRWWDFLAYRRRYVSDLVWFGLGMVIVGCGTLTDGGLPAWLSVCALVAGLAMLAVGVRRAVRVSRLSKEVDDGCP
ncbi:hypothetical protein [Micromonospora globispora]|uniref:hypothetical protein n=1 Tax=Micromonospora globispora TaxID=1450148 RepID=UPI000F5D899A|nr:hypothetical protein [Micromonospora globispora]